MSLVWLARTCLNCTMRCWTRRRSAISPSNTRRLPAAWPTPGDDLTGKPGVCFVTAGPGATNSLTGVAQAYMAASPLIHVSGAVPQGASFESFHGVDRADFLVGVFSDVTKWSVSVERAEDIPHVFAEAFRIAQSDRPGPVHIELPENVLLADPTEMDTYAALPITRTPLDGGGHARHR